MERALCVWRREAEAKERGSSGDEVGRRREGGDSEREHLVQRWAGAARCGVLQGELDGLEGTGELWHWSSSEQTAEAGCGQC